MVVSSVQSLRDRLGWLIRSRIPWWALIAIGIILRMRQYLIARSLWADEASLAMNLAFRPLSGLLEPLSYKQGAPIGFLFIEKLLVLVLGNSDQVMRLFPLFSGITALYLCYRIAQAHIRGGMLASLLLTISWPLIYYSSELKQYSSDVMVGLLLVLLSSRCVNENPRIKDFWILGIVGAIAIWISHPAAFVLAGIGLTLFIAMITRKPPIPVSWLVGLAAIWAISFGIHYFVSLRHLIGDDFLQRFWRNGYMPFPPWADLPWFARTYQSMLYISLRRGDLALATMIPALVLLGSLSLFFRNRNMGLIIVFPFFFASVASVLHKYPLRERFMLFLVPFLFLLVAEGLGRIHMLVANRNRPIASVLSALLALLIFWPPASTTFSYFLSPYNRADIKPVMEYVVKNRLHNEIIYVYHSSEPAFNYYAPLYGIGSENVLIGYDTASKRRALREFFRDMEELQGNDRVWFIFSDIVDCGGCNGDMQTFYVEHLNSFGTMLDSFHASGANAYLYDLDP